MPIPQWPLAQKPDTTTTSIYRGNDAKLLLQLLDKSTFVRIGDEVVSVVWTPAVAVPKPIVETFMAPPVVKHSTPIPMQ
jgi:hypothetical protein